MPNKRIRGKLVYFMGERESAKFLIPGIMNGANVKEQNFDSSVKFEINLYLFIK